MGRAERENSLSVGVWGCKRTVRDGGTKSRCDAQWGTCWCPISSTEGQGGAVAEPGVPGLGVMNWLLMGKRCMYWMEMSLPWWCQRWVQCFMS